MNVNPLNIDVEVNSTCTCDVEALKHGLSTVVIDKYDEASKQKLVDYLNSFFNHAVTCDVQVQRITK